LLLAKYNDENLYKDILNNKLNNSIAGAIYENLVAIFLAHQNYSLYYFGEPGNYSIDFVIKNNNQIYLLDVKKKNNISKSMRYFLKSTNYLAGIKVIGGNFGKSEKMITIPH
jgi:predicted AAA+ superfamily ATPase